MDPRAPPAATAPLIAAAPVADAVADDAGTRSSSKLLRIFFLALVNILNTDLRASSSSACWRAKCSVRKSIDFKSARQMGQRNPSSISSEVALGSSSLSKGFPDMPAMSKRYKQITTFRGCICCCGMRFGLFNNYSCTNISIKVQMFLYCQFTCHSCEIYYKTYKFNLILNATPPLLLAQAR